MEIKAESRHVRVSPKKLKFLIRGLKGMTVSEILARLTLFNKSGAADIKKLIESAKANASHNFKIPTETLTVKSITVGKAGTMKRFRAASRGVAHSYKKRLSHLKISLISG